MVYELPPGSSSNLKLMILKNIRIMSYLGGDIDGTQSSFQKLKFGNNGQTHVKVDVKNF